MVNICFLELFCFAILKRFLGIKVIKIIKGSFLVQNCLNIFFPSFFFILRNLLNYTLGKNKVTIS